MNTREGDFWADRSVPRIAPEQFNEIVATAADLAIVVDLKGIVQSLVVNPLNPGLGRLDHWEKRDIRDFLAEDSLKKLERQLEAYQGENADGTDSIEVNHYDNANWEFPIRYTMHRTGDQDLILMLGRDMRPIAELQSRLVKAQLTLEQNYEAHRDFETRYRVLMDAARDAFVLIDPTNAKIIDANAAAGLVLGSEPKALIGSNFAQEFEGRKTGEFLESLLGAMTSQSGASVSVQSRRTGRSLTLSGTQFRAAGDRIVLVRLEKAGSPETVAEDLSVVLAHLYRDGADAIVVTDKIGMIRYANDSFLTMTDSAQLSDVKGVSLGDYLNRGSVDVKVLIDNANRSGSMPVYSTRLRSSFGSQLAVEMSATHLSGWSTSGYAFVMRDASRMELVRSASTEMPTGMGGLGETASQNVMDLVGSAALKDIVAATTDVVEKMCIQTAVELTRNNRVAAAEMLGLSRQSLYVKLRKYGLLSKES